MSKGLEALRLCEERDGILVRSEINIIEKELKALEIIKKKKVNVGYIGWYHNYNDYLVRLKSGKSQLADKKLTEEEFDLLKEVLANDSNN